VGRRRGMRVEEGCDEGRREKGGVRVFFNLFLI